MKKQVQSTGERDWFADHITGIQDEVWKVLENWLGQYDQPCIVSGCNVTTNGSNYDVSAGILLLKDIDGHYQFCEFAGATNISLPRYVFVTKTVTNGLYYDSNTKPIANTYTATMQTALPSDGYYMQFLATGTAKWQDIVQDSKHRMVTDAQINAWTSNIAVVSGMIMIWPANTIPSGWLECDGSAVSRTTEAGIFAAIGTNYGAGDGSTTFNIPDLRGQFVRGFDNGKGVDAGRALGSEQSDAIKETTIDLKMRQSNNNFAYGSNNSLVFDPSGGGANVSVTIGAGNTETHPKNVAMKFIIKK